jgi:hypothetical protein
MRREWIAAILALMLIGTAFSASAQEGKMTREDYLALPYQEQEAARAAEKARQARIKANPPRARAQGAPGGPMPPGVIVYDTGTFSAIPTLPVAGASFADFAIGNRFNTANGNPVALPLTVNSLAFWPALIDGDSTGTGVAFISIFGAANTGAGTADWIDDQSKANLAPGTWNTRSFTGGVGVFTGTGAASFQAGVWNPGDASTTTTVPCATDCVGIDTGTVNGQGFHGMMVQDINGLSWQQFDWNALVRPIGTNVPVELMDFKVE